MYKLYAYMEDGLIAIFTCDEIKEQDFENKKMIDIFIKEYDEDYEISFNKFIGNLICTSYELKEVSHG